MRLRALAFAVVMLCGLVTPVLADTMNWQFRSFAEYTVDVKLYSQSRRIVWPSATTVWSLRDYKVHKIPISCVAGERICFGAWVQGNSRRAWGKGSDGNLSCQNCCYICDDGKSTPIIDLNER